MNEPKNPWSCRGFFICAILLVVKFQIAFLILGLGLLAATTIVEFEESPTTRFDFYAPPEDLEHFALGYNESIADSLWLRVIQNIDTCEKVEGGIAHSKERIAARKQGLISGPSCEKGWVFHMLDAITKLAPKFEMPYVAGATALSILVDDREGAAIIYERGVKQFPTNWTMAYRAGYHFLEEVKDPAKASEYLLQAARNGAPHWVYALAGRLQNDLGRALLAKSIYQEALARDPNGTGADWIRAKLADLDSIIEKEQTGSKENSANVRKK